MRKWSRRFPRLSQQPSPAALGAPNKPAEPDPNSPANYASVWLEIKELLFRVFALEQNGGGGTGTVTSITATTPIVVTPSPITTVGVVSHATSGVSAATYGDSTHVAQIAINATGHITSATAVAISGSGGLSSPLTTKGDVWGYSSVDARIPIGTNDYVLTADSAQTLGLKWAPIPAAGKLQGQEFTTAGSATFNVPTGVTAIWITAVGAGAGGGTRATALGAGGGGSGEYGEMIPLKVTSGGTVSLTVGAKGTGAAAGGGTATGADGGATIVGPYNFLGGLGGVGTTSAGGTGGGPRGGLGGGASNTGAAGTQESVSFWGGGGGGGGGNATPNNGSAGAPSPGRLTGAAGGTAASTQAGGGGGAGSVYGLGGAGGGGGVAGSNAASTSYGTGGGGAGGLTGSTAAGGNGCDGYVLIMWVA